MANYLTISRILLILPVLILVSPESSLCNWIALLLFVIAGITDHLDGYVARKTGTVSETGGLLDLIADKLFICITLIYLLLKFNYLDLLVPALIIISRELIISSFRQFIAERSRNPLKVSLIGKTKTTIQILALSFLIISPNFLVDFYYITIFLFWLAAYISIHSLVDYLRTYFKFISDEDS